MPKDNSKAARAQRRADAEERQAKRDMRSAEQQITVLNGRRGTSRRERTRLGD